jgi:hypothetical protein
LSLLPEYAWVGLITFGTMVSPKDCIKLKWDIKYFMIC